MSSNIRNFCILAHIDHGKSTLADRLLEITGTVDKRQLKPQFLDQLESERERGITIKMAPVRMRYGNYLLNLIDTPGHSDFAYEVSRALAAVEGAVLLVDITQGIQAQTLANFESAKKAKLKIIGAVTKIDLDSSQLESAVKTLSELIGVQKSEIARVSGKTGEGIPELLEKIAKEIPPPKYMDVGRPYIGKGLVFDSLYDEHKGVIAFVRVFGGEFKSGDKAFLLANKTETKIKEVGYFSPQFKPCPKLSNGEIGYIATGIKDPQLLKIGDTIIEDCKLKIENCRPLAGYKEPQPVVFVSFYPEESDDYENLKKALSRLQLSDPSLVFEPDSSDLLGRGFKGGFLGRLHFEITAERLEKEFKLATVHSFPSVAYKVKTKLGVIDVKSPKDFPDDYLEAEEPVAAMEILAPAGYLGAILSLKKLFRFGEFKTETLGDRLIIKTELPLADLISDLHDKLKSVSEGYASLSYELKGYKKSDLEKLEILIAGHPVPGLTRIVPKENTQYEARQTVEKLKELLPRQQFVQAIQARAGSHIIARETISALKKDVTGYLYGGDRTRKMKLWKKQQKGKARLKERAGRQQIKIPASVFKELLKT